MIIIKEYDPEWPKEFETIRSHLQEVLGPRAQHIDHIGSTSVPGLGAKDVIDIQITVQELSPKIIQKMVNAGYEHVSRITSDHVPLGEDSDPRLWEKFIFNQPQGARRANIHVRVEAIQISAIRCCFEIICARIPIPPNPSNSSNAKSPNITQTISKPITISKTRSTISFGMLRWSGQNIQTGNQPNLC